MNEPSKDIADMLADKSSLALTFGTDLFVSNLPDSPDDCVAVYDAPGDSPEQGSDIYRPGIQIQVRGASDSYSDTWSEAFNIREELDGKYNVTKNGSCYIGIFAVGEIIPLGRDRHNRPVFSMNFRLIRESA